ncbi:MAG: MmcB family DNA repair protein [Pseudomonadota bacterium]
MTTEFSNQPAAGHPSSAPDPRPDITAAVTRGASVLLIDMGYAPFTELTLPNGRRADVTGLSDKGEIIMIEVKSCRADFDVDNKWPEYKDYCDQFFFAVTEDFDTDLLPQDEGLIIADGFGGAVVREAITSRLAGARRKAMLVRLARQAAFRTQI